ncbi:MAG: hypothetical protein SAK29_38020 [Scytonema sp. PMC 1069.18]|nr:hypothetical protein [Scytonema sp. PMC 1069.18]MEC4885186.1 hypothetical protein [Scytonema sp. PMC 1070.18]
MTILTHAPKLKLGSLELVVPLGQLLNGDCIFIDSIPELDPYRHLRDRK